MVLIVAGVALAALVMVITIALCRAAADADRQAEKQLREFAHEGYE